MNRLQNKYFKTHQMFSSTLRRRKLRLQQSPDVLNLCLREPLEGKSHDYRDVIIFEKPCFENVSVHTKTQSLHFQILPV